MAGEYRAGIKRGSSELFYDDAQVRPGKRSHCEMSSPETSRSASLPFPTAAPRLPPWGPLPQQSPSSSTAVQPSEHSGQTGIGWQVPGNEGFRTAFANDPMEDCETSAERHDVSSPDEDEDDLMEFEASGTVSRSSSVPDLRVLVNGLRPSSKLQGLSLTPMSSLATALIPFKAPQGGHLV